MMMTAGAVTVLLNGCVVVWRVRGTMKDLEREEVYNKVWDYLLHGITVRCAFVVIVVVVVVYFLVFLFPAYTLQEPSLFCVGSGTCSLRL